MKDAVARILGGRACRSCGHLTQVLCADCHTPVCGDCVRSILDPDGDPGRYREVCPHHLDLSCVALRRLMGLEPGRRFDPLDLESVPDDFLAPTSNATVHK